MVSFLERYVATPLRKPVILTFLNRGTAVSSALDRHYSFKVDHWSIFKWEVKRNREKSREIAKNREKSRKIAKKIKIRERHRIFWVFFKKMRLLLWIWIFSWFFSIFKGSCTAKILKNPETMQIKTGLVKKLLIFRMRPSTSARKAAKNRLQIAKNC